MISTWNLTQYENVFFLYLYMAKNQFIDLVTCQFIVNFFMVDYLLYVMALTTSLTGAYYLQYDHAKFLFSYLKFLLSTNTYIRTFIPKIDLLWLVINMIYDKKRSMEMYFLLLSSIQHVDLFYYFIRKKNGSMAKISVCQT